MEGNISREEVEALLAADNEQQDERAPGPASQFQMVPIPVTIVTRDDMRIECPELGAWGYTPYGVFASGKVDGSDVEWLIPYNSVLRIEFDYAAYFQAIQEAEASPIEGQAIEVDPVPATDSEDAVEVVTNEDASEAEDVKASSD